MTCPPGNWSTFKTVYERKVDNSIFYAWLLSLRSDWVPPEDQFLPATLFISLCRCGEWSVVDENWFAYSQSSWSVIPTPFSYRVSTSAFKQVKLKQESMERNRRSHKRQHEHTGFEYGARWPCTFQVTYVRSIDLSPSLRNSRFADENDHAHLSGHDHSHQRNESSEEKAKDQCFVHRSLGKCMANALHIRILYVRAVFCDSSYFSPLILVSILPAWMPTYSRDMKMGWE